MKVGVFGGTFDPIHLGHLILAEQAREQGSLDEVWFLPAPRPPQKDARAITRLDTREDMLELALAGNPSFRIEHIEKERDGPSYTVDTLKLLRERHPGHEFSLILGGDSLADLPSWRDPVGIVRQAGLLVMTRQGNSHPDAETLRKTLGMPATEKLDLRFIEAPLISISSRDLRQRVATGQSIRYMVPRAVEVIIRDRKLYRSQD